MTAKCLRCGQAQGKHMQIGPDRLLGPDPDKSLFCPTIGAYEDEKSRHEDAERRWEAGDKEPLARLRAFDALRALESNLSRFPRTMTPERVLRDLRLALTGWALETLT